MVDDSTSGLRPLGTGQSIRTAFCRNDSLAANQAGCDASEIVSVLASRGQGPEFTSKL